MTSEKTILITGGTGSFGRFILKRLLLHTTKEIRIFSRDEKKQYDMRIEFAHVRNVSFIVGDIRDYAAVREAISGVDIIYQAAALKQVPNCEQFPMEAINTNILGVHNVIQAALEEGVEIVVAVSTDKAVKPVNVMGMTKALQEKLITRANFSPKNKGTRFVCVRYGNVMHSRGSVIPYFKKLLCEGESVPITHPEMTRFILTLDDAIDLVLYASEHCQGGDIFVKKAPSTRIITLAEILAEKYSPNGLQTHITGVRTGEKIHEILISEEEMVRTADMGDYFIVFSPQQYTPPVEGLEEYSSREHIADKESIRVLLERSEKLIDQDRFSQGYFSF